MFAIGSDETDALDEASRRLDDAKSLPEIKAIRDTAEAARTYARAARLGLEFQNRAAAIRLRAERKAGCLLASLKLRGGDRRSKNWRCKIKLEEVGISRAESKRWQQLSAVAETTFCDYLLAMNHQCREVTATGLLRLARLSREQPTHQLSFSDQDARRSKKWPFGQIEAALELTKHARLLISLLRPHCARATLQLTLPEMKLVNQLMSEIGELTRKLSADDDL